MHARGGPRMHAPGKESFVLLCRRMDATFYSSIPPAAHRFKSIPAAAPTKALAPTARCDLCEYN